MAGLFKATAAVLGLLLVVLFGAWLAAERARSPSGSTRQAEASLTREAASRESPIYTEVVPFIEFTLAETHHQKYRLCCPSSAPSTPRTMT